MRKVFIIFLIIFLCNGCKEFKILFGKKMKLKIFTKKKEQKIEYIKDLKLAESILWPQPFEFSLERDPFYPLIGGEEFLSSDLEELPEARLDLKIIGIFIGKQKVALLGSEESEETMVVKEGDKIGEFVVKNIDSNKVTLEKDGKEIVLNMEKEEDEGK